MCYCGKVFIHGGSSIDGALHLEPKEGTMLDADRIFLKDFQNFTFKNHMMAVEALLQGGRKAKEHAALYLKHENPSLDDVGAVALEKRTNGCFFQKVMLAKIFAEFVGAVEDFGALCFAVCHRGPDEGILRRYLASSVGDVGTFFAHVLQHPW